jgi:nucleolar protein 56
LTDRPAPSRELLTTWFGAFLVEHGRVLDSRPFRPEDLEDRMRRRHAGEPVAEELEILERAKAGPVATRDRRLTSQPGVVLGGGARVALDPATFGLTLEQLRTSVLAVAADALRTSWDPSIHVQEAVRSLADLDELKNLLGERLVSWGSRDLADPELAGSEGADSMARSLVEGARSEDPTFTPEEPELVRARRSLAELYRSIESVRTTLEGAVTEALPRRAPNVSALLGPLLAARMLAQAGGLDRLARLPASTIQVLGAEKAFFEHLRGRAPPPRHGLLFLHPTIQGAPRRLRGKLARALAGKVAIAARIDREGGALHPELVTAYEARTKAVRTEGPGTRAKRSRPPLDGAAEDG